MCPLLFAGQKQRWKGSEDLKGVAHLDTGAHMPLTVSLCLFVSYRVAWQYLRHAVVFPVFRATSSSSARLPCDAAAASMFNTSSASVAWLVATFGSFRLRFSRFMFHFRPPELMCTAFIEASTPDGFSLPSPRNLELHTVKLREGGSLTRNINPTDDDDFPSRTPTKPKSQLGNP